MLDIAGVLREAANPALAQDFRSDVIKSVEGELERLPAPTNLALESAAPIIHYIFTAYPQQRANIVSLCSTLEAASIESVTERFHFDHLLCSFIEYRSSAEPADAKDAERREVVILAFRYIKLLLALRKTLPVSVLRSLVAVCEAAKGSDNEKYVPSFVGYLCEASLLSDVSRVPEVCSVLVADLVKRGSLGVARLIAYSIEMGLPLVRSSKMLWPLMAPLSEYKVSDAAKPDEVGTSGVKAALEYLLQTWPGLMYFGIQGGAVVQLIRCLPKETEVVISILKNLLRLEGSSASITDPLSGLLLDILLKGGLIEKLNELVSKPSVSQFLNEILPYAGTCGVDMPKQAFQEQMESSSSGVSNAMWFNLSQAVKYSQQTMSLAAVEKMVQLEYQKWDWAVLLMMFTVVLPHNEQDASSSQAKEIYSKLLGFFGGPFLKLKPNLCVNMIEPLYALINFLITKQNGGIIKSNAALAAGLASVIDGMSQNVGTEPNSPQWALFKCLGLILTSTNGGDLLNGMKSGGQSIFDKLTALCKGCTDEKVCAAFLDVVDFGSFSEMFVPLVQYFLISKTVKVHETAINELRKKRYTSENSLQVMLESILLRHMESISDDPSMVDGLTMDLNFLAEMLSTDQRVVDLVVEGKSAQRFDTIIRKHSHFVLAILMSNEKMLDRSWVDDEIQWWMETGNREYVKIYDKAVECTFARTLDVATTKEPSIVNYHGTTTAPPHIFATLAQTPRGVKKLTEYIPRLMSALSCAENDNFEDIRAAMFALSHFGSSPYASISVEQHKIPEVMIDNIEDCDSYVLRGTLLAALSLFKPSKYLASVLRARHWQLFRFGSHFTVIPEDAHKWLGEVTQIPMTLPTVPDLPEYQEAVSSLKLLANSLVSGSALEKLRVMKTADNPMLKEPALSFFAFNLLSQFYYEPSSRRSIFSLFASVPIMGWDDAGKWQDTLQTAEMSCRVYLMTSDLKQHSGVTTAFSSIQVPTYSVDKIRAMQPPPRCPEFFLDDGELGALCGCTKAEFYNKPADEQQKLREKITAK